MDFFDERVLAAFKDGKPKSFAALLSEVSFSHNTLQQHLGRLTAKGLVVRMKLAATGFGRPKFAYHVPLRGSKQVTAALEDPAMELVAIPFSRLRMFAGLRRVVTVKRRRKAVRLKSAAKLENKTYHHFTPIKGQASALLV